MKRFVCLLAVAALLLSGCGLDFLKKQSTQMPDADVVEYRDLRYFASNLDEAYYMNLCAYYEAALNFEQWCDLPYPMEQSRVEDIIAILRYECPELMMLDTTQSFDLYAVSDMVSRVEVPYLVTQTQYQSMLEETKAVIGELAQQCAGLDDAQKEKLIYDHIVSNCIYDETALYGGTAYGCLVEGSAKCDGISSAMKWALEEVGISCMTISGEPVDGGVGHAWNVVRIDGQWYDLDVTADVPQDSQTEACYPAYNTSDSWIRERYIVDDAYALCGSLPGTADMTESYHGLSGHYIEAGQDDRLEELYAQAYDEGGSFVLQFESKADFEAFEQDLEQRLEKLGNKKGWRSWSWTTMSVPDYRTVRITAGT